MILYKFRKVLPRNPYDEKEMLREALEKIPVVEKIPAEWYDSEEDDIWESFLKELEEKERGKN